MLLTVVVWWAEGVLSESEFGATHGGSMVGGKCAPAQPSVGGR